MKTSESIIATYVAERKAIEQKREEIQQRIYALQRKIEWNKKQEEKTWGYTHFTDAIIMPIMEEVAKQTTGIHWDCLGEKKLHVFGLRCECPVFGHNMPFDNNKTWNEQDPNRKCIASLCFTYSDGVLSYDITNERGNYETIAEMNGLNNKVVKVESIEQIVEFVNSQLQ